MEDQLRIYSAYLDHEVKYVGKYDWNDSENNPLPLTVRSMVKIFPISKFKDYDYTKLILFSLEWLFKEITVKGYYGDAPFNPIKILCNRIHEEKELFAMLEKGLYEGLYVWQFNLLLQWGFNVFNIPESDYIKKETLKQ